MSAGRPITNSKEITSELEKLNARLDEIVATLPKQPKQLSEEEKAVFIKAGVPIPENVLAEDETFRMLKGMKATIEDIGFYVTSKRTEPTIDITDKINKIDTKLTGISWTLVLTLAFACLFSILSFKGCNTKQEIKPPDNTTVVTLTMDQWNYDLVKTAMSSVIRDINTYENLDEAFKALYSEMPRTIRDQVMETVKKKCRV